VAGAVEEMTNDETRMKTISHLSGARTVMLRFGLRASDLIRHSSFIIRHCLP